MLANPRRLRAALLHILVVHVAGRTGRALRWCRERLTRLPAALRKARQSLQIQICLALRELLSPATSALLICTLSVAGFLGLLFNPPITVTTGGQIVKVSFVGPLTWSGNIEAVLSDNLVKTKGFEIYSPLRPRYEISQLRINEESKELGDPKTAPQALRKFGLDLAVWTALSFAIKSLIVFLMVVLGAALIAHTKLWRSPAHKWRMSVAYLIIGAVVWNGSAAAMAIGARQITSFESPDQLFGREILSPTVAPVGKVTREFKAAVIGDSTVAYLSGYEIHRGCSRSADAPAVIIGQAYGWNVANLACSGATSKVGFLGPQTRNGETMGPQLGYLKQMKGLEAVVAGWGANDFQWGAFVQGCFVQTRCDDSFSSAHFDALEQTFIVDSANVMKELAALDGKPKVVILLPYTAFLPTAPEEHPDCPDLQRDGYRLTRQKIEVINARTERVRQVLKRAAESYGFVTAQPNLTPLCESESSEKPDLWGINLPQKQQSYALHPTHSGSFKIAIATIIALEQYPSHDEDEKPTTTVLDPD
jgi:GDSL-like Lipase/Acylhydrolase family